MSAPTHTWHTIVRGHAVVFDQDARRWVFDDTGEIVTEANTATRPCTHCDKEPTVDGHDACIADLLGVQFACCGHGEEFPAYVSFADDRPPVYHGAALDYFQALGRGPEAAA